jgi:hypothetical protein
MGNTEIQLTAGSRQIGNDAETRGLGDAARDKKSDLLNDQNNSNDFNDLDDLYGFNDLPFTLLP